MLSSAIWLSLSATMLTAQTSSKPAVLYAALGTELSTYKLEVEAAVLTKLSSVTLPQNVQEAWPHPSRRYLYVAWSNNTPGPDGRHGITAFRVDPSTGELKQHGQPISVPARSVFITVDSQGKAVVAASNIPSSATVHHIAADGT